LYQFLVLTVSLTFFVFFFVFPTGGLAAGTLPVVSDLLDMVLCWIRWGPGRLVLSALRIKEVCGWGKRVLPHRGYLDDERSRDCRQGWDRIWTVSGIGTKLCCFSCCFFKTLFTLFFGDGNGGYMA
jgi:hypothetical protein